MKGEKNIELSREETVEEKENVGGPEEGGELRPQLPPGFYEVEAMRRKTVRKGEVQYYIKWRDWPESTNTWEPLENLETCLDIVEAFEKSSRNGKQRPSKKRKNRSGCPVRQAKKKQQRTPAMASPVVGGAGMGKWTDDMTEEEEESEEKEVPCETPVEIAARKIKEYKTKEEEKRKEELEAQSRVARQTRSARKTAMGQPIGVQFQNTNDNPVIIDDDEEIRSFTVRGVTLTALTYYKNGKHCVPTEGLIEAIDKKLPSVNEEQRKALEEEKKELVKKLEAKVERRGKGLGS